MRKPCFNVPRICGAIALAAASAWISSAPGPVHATVSANTDSAQSANAWGPAQLVVYKSRRLVALYRFGNFEKEYPVALGLQPLGAKRHANDARTPEGLYHVVAKRPHERWQYFLAIDYPNASDSAAYAEAVRQKKIPDENGKPFAIGGAIGIHGNDRADDQASPVDWTKGCIALRKSDIAEIAERVAVGTPVWIVE